MAAPKKDTKHKTHLQIFEAKINKSRWRRTEVLGGAEIQYEWKNSRQQITVPFWYSFDTSNGELIRLERYTDKIKFLNQEDRRVLNILHFSGGTLYSEEFIELNSGIPLHCWSEDLYYTLKEPNIVNNPQEDFEWISKQGEKIIHLGETIRGFNDFYNLPWDFNKILTEYGIRYVEADSNVRPSKDYIKSGQWINEI